MTDSRSATENTTKKFNKLVEKINEAFEEYYSGEDYMPVVLIKQKEIKEKTAHESWVNTVDHTLEIPRLWCYMGVTRPFSYGFIPLHEDVHSR